MWQQNLKLNCLCESECEVTIVHIASFIEGKYLGCPFICCLSLPGVLWRVLSTSGPAGQCGILNFRDVFVQFSELKSTVCLCGVLWTCDWRLVLENWPVCPGIGFVLLGRREGLREHRVLWHSFCFEGAAFLIWFVSQGHSPRVLDLCCVSWMMGCAPSSEVPLPVVRREHCDCGWPF